MTPTLMKNNCKICDKTICEIANKLTPKSYTSREFIKEMGKYLKKMQKEKFIN